MSRGMIILAILLIVAIGGAVLLSRRVHEQPVRTIETNVTGHAAG